MGFFVYAIPCRSELARDGFQSTVCTQTARVIVVHHREQSSVDRLLLQGFELFGTLFVINRHRLNLWIIGG